MGKIQIAPDLDEITVSGNSVQTTFNGGLTYSADGLQNYKEDYIKNCFRAAILFSSKPHQVKHLMNEHLHLEGKIS